MPRILIVADDLTGALDSSAAFAQRGMSTCVVTRPEGVRADDGLDAFDVLVVNTRSREGSGEDAIAAIQTVFDNLPALPPVIFKKIDSRLKGHVAAETKALAELIDRHSLIVCPAIPSQKRIVRNGMLQGSGVDIPTRVSDYFEFEELEVTVLDASTDAEIDQALASLPPKPLFVGAAGLSGALARREKDRGALPLPALKGPAIFAVGSRDPITLSQLVQLRMDHSLAEVSAVNGIFDQICWPNTPITLAVLAPGAERISAELAGARFAEGLGKRLADAPPATLFACGGETATGILDSIGVEVVEVRGEVLPGVPVSAANVRGREMTLLTKSGGFGDRNVLADLARAIEV